MTRPLSAVLAVLTLSAAVVVPTAMAGQPAPAAAPKSPLALRVTCDGRGEDARLRVQIANTADRDTAVLLGFTVPNTQVHVVDSSLDVFVIRPATGADEDYVYVNGKYALVKGGVPWVVSIPAGKTYDLDLPVRDFISRLNYTNLDVSVAPGGRLVLDAQPAGKQVVWTGKIETRVDRCQ